MSVFSYKTYIAIIGDIKKSKNISERNCVQEKLKNILCTINKRYADDIAAKFMITLGDEFQGLLSNGRYVYEIIEYIQQEMHPVGIRFGIGIGAITTEINSEMAIGADGPGYYNAREAVEGLKQEEHKNKVCAADVKVKTENDIVTKMLNTIFSLIYILKENWTERQREIVWEFRKNGCNQSQCAERFGIAQSTVQRALNSAKYYAYKEAAETVKSVLEEVV